MPFHPALQDETDNEITSELHDIPAPSPAPPHAVMQASAVPPPPPPAAAAAAPSPIPLPAIMQAGSVPPATAITQGAPAVNHQISIALIAIAPNTGRCQAYQ